MYKNEEKLNYQLSIIKKLLIVDQVYLYFSLARSFGYIAKENESTLHVHAEGGYANRDGEDDDDVYDYNVHEESDEEGGGTGDTETETDETIETDETETETRKTTVMTKLICKLINKIAYLLFLAFHICM